MNQYRINEFISKSWKIINRSLNERKTHIEKLESKNALILLKESGKTDGNLLRLGPL